MKYVLIIAAALLLFCLRTDALGQTRCQGELASATTRFDQATAKYRDAFRDLLRARALGRLAVGDSSAARIAQALATGDDPHSVESGYAPGTAVLFYAYEDSNFSAWLLTGAGVVAYCRRAIPPVRLTNAIDRLRNALGFSAAQRSRTPRLLIQGGASVPPPRKIPLAPAVRTLSDLLLPPPVAAELMQIHHLIVVPILDIGTVPFALLRPFPSRGELIDHMSVTIAPDLVSLAQPVGTWDPDFASPLVIGNPYLAPDSRWELPPLPGAEREAVQIGALLKVRPLLAKEASKETVLRRAETADGLFFAAHGVANSTDPLSGGFLALSAGDYRSGWWTAKEVQSTRLRAKLAVLSACQTGLGQTHDAGIVGLARAFQLAGVPRVVMSLWSVNDAASDELMQAFMRHLLAEGQPTPAEALRQAMLEIKQKHPDPAKWAAFMVFGTPR